MPRGPLGVLDSGVGGLSVLRHLRAALPATEMVYVADQRWCPYGPRPPAQVRERVVALVEGLLERGAGAIVVACNTASTVALEHIRRRYPSTAFVGMEPAVKPAAARSGTGAIGVLATATTARGEALARLVDAYGRDVVVHVAVPHGLVEVVEAGDGDGPAAEASLRPILERWRSESVDTIVLGCTHYPFARDAVARLAGPSVEIIDPAPAVARQAARVLADLEGVDPSPTTASAAASIHLLTTGDPIAFGALARRLIGEAWVDDARVGAFDG